MPLKNVKRYSRVDRFHAGDTLLLPLVPLRPPFAPKGRDAGGVNGVYEIARDRIPAVGHSVDLHGARRRIVSKERIGARWKVTREKAAKTPYSRVRERDDVSEAVKDRLRAAHATLNPKTMKTEIDRRTKRVFDVQKRYGHPRTISKSV